MYSGFKYMFNDSGNTLNIYLNGSILTKAKTPLVRGMEKIVR
jgi:hypothetical protein